MISARFQGRLGGFALDVEFQAPASGVTVLFGPSGSGKTTVLRCIAGLTRLAGRFEVDGDVWQDERTFLPAHRRRVGYVFQDAALFDHLNVRGNLLYGRRRAGRGADAAFDRLVALLGLEELLHRSPARLSGGERQRVAIGRALLAEPRLLLLDEPLASLDAARKAELLPYFDALRREAAAPVFYVTHDVTEAARLGDRMLLIRDGRLVETAAAQAPDEAGGIDRLAARLRAVGPEALAAELILSGAPSEVARLAVEALAARG
ncbi:MAG: molybdenum ABC transporter ATP-binding protein [Phenylobacterium sp.]|uniref:molybdenum ABC transporter ATP-binding protein n=1 Tax=Phenylobacterium sp. TaxID=1871053 RepID=UPI0025ED4F17|nr:molybdenum ABC transporter ATP-binding protein [Phenylobacterium sp.]MBI1198408.1 molybdenum ABC transporter ATP-binding protein [Phenylobacterium sp.]